MYLPGLSQTPRSPALSALGRKFRDVFKSGKMHSTRYKGVASKWVKGIISQCDGRGVVGRAGRFRHRDGDA